MKTQLIPYLWLILPIALWGLWKAFKKREIYKFQNSSEAKVTNTLLESLPLDKWHILNNITLKTETGTTQIDHIVVSRFGVFVIETKDYKGWIFADAKSKKWTQVIYSWRFKFQNPIHQNYGHVKAVQALLDFVPTNNIESIVVFVGRAQFKTEKPSGVYELSTMVDYLRSKKDEVLTENRMQFIVGRIECLRLQLTKETDIQHQQHLRTK